MYLVRTVIAIIFAIVLIILGVIFVRWLFRGSPAPVSTKPLHEYAQTDARVSFLTDGVINGDDLHRQIRITISRSERTIDVIRGYNGNVIKSKTQANNESAYDEFLNALRYARFSAERRSSVQKPDGVCPLGYRYIYSLTGSGKDDTDFNFWSTTCRGGTSGAQTKLVNELFQKQITDYRRFINEVDLRATESTD